MAARWRVGVAPIKQCLGHMNISVEQKGTIWDCARGQLEWKCGDPECLIKNFMSAGRCRKCHAEFDYEHAYLCHPDGEPGVKQTHTYFPKMPKTLRNMKGENAERYKHQFRAWPARKRDRNRGMKRKYKGSGFDSSNARRAQNRRPWWPEGRASRDQEATQEVAPDHTEPAERRTEDRSGVAQRSGHRWTGDPVPVPITTATTRVGSSASRTTEAATVTAIPITTVAGASGPPRQEAAHKDSKGNARRSSTEDGGAPRDKADPHPVLALTVKAAPKGARETEGNRLAQEAQPKATGVQDGVEPKRPRTAQRQEAATSSVQQSPHQNASSMQQSPLQNATSLEPPRLSWEDVKHCLMPLDQVNKWRANIDQAEGQVGQAEAKLGHQREEVQAQKYQVELQACANGRFQVAGEMTTLAQKAEKAAAELNQAVVKYLDIMKQMTVAEANECQWHASAEVCQGQQARVPRRR